MPLDLSGARVLLTGASSGIGAAAAALLTASGHRVIGASRRASAPAGVHPVRMDVDDPDAVEAAVAEAVAVHGRLDALVNSAGWGLAGAVETTPVPEAKAQMETNFWGAVRVTLAALPALRSSGRGLIVNVSSLGGVVGLPFQAYYSASKYALEGWSEALAYEVAPFGVGVTLIEPGNVRTGFTASRREATGMAAALYGEPARRAVGAMERGERAGVTPEAVARAIARVLEAERPPRRVAVGSTFERVMAMLHRLLPMRAFERLATDPLLGK